MKDWIRANTPEAATIAAVATQVAAYFTGAESLADALTKIAAALIVFALAESHVDAAAKVQ